MGRAHHIEKDARAVDVRLSKRGADLLRSCSPLRSNIRLMEGILSFRLWNGTGYCRLLSTLPFDPAGLQGEEASLFFEGLHWRNMTDAEIVRSSRTRRLPYHPVWDPVLRQPLP